MISFGKIVKACFKDIRFWILLFFLIRLYGITNPPLEVAHNWRQTTVSMVSRNFFEVDANIFHPRIDIAGEKTGITGMEFPFLNYLIYLMSLLFGYSHWYGRLLNLIISSIGLHFFYKLIKLFFKSEVAFNATLILLFSVWFTFSRKIMPDTFAMSFIIMAIYYGSNYLKFNKKVIDLIYFFLFTTIGVLSKLPSGYILVIFSLFIFSKEILFRQKIIFSIVLASSIIAPAIWYFNWVPFLVQKYEYWHFFMGKSFSQGIAEILANMPQTLERFYDTSIKYVGFALFLFGIFMAIKVRNKLLINIFVLGFSGFLVIILKAGFAFYHHTYYIIPFVPVMALLSGYGLYQIKQKKIIVVVLIFIGLECILNNHNDFRIKKNNLTLLNLEKDLDRVSNPNDLILINSGKYPTPMYFAHRKGWIDYNDNIINKSYIMDLKEKGLEYIVILKKAFGSNIDLDYKIAFKNEDYAIYEL